MSDPAKEPRKYYQPPELEVVSDGELSNDVSSEDEYSGDEYKDDQSDTEYFDREYDIYHYGVPFSPSNKYCCEFLKPPLSPENSVALTLHEESELAKYGLNEESFKTIRRALHQALHGYRYPGRCDMIEMSYMRNENYYVKGGILDQKILFTLYQAKYNCAPISPLFLNSKHFITKILQEKGIPSTLNENLTKQQMRFNEARFHQLLHMQGIILIAQIVTVCSGYKFLLAWDPDLLIHFLEVHVEN